jgi:glutamate racemase
MIGVFDSGSGGLSVLKAIRARVPLADIVYFGDLKNVPYGNKSRNELDALTTAGIETLLKHGATQIVSACNSVALSTMQSCEACHMPLHDAIEMVGPTAQGFTDCDARVLVLATKATIESEIYQREFRAVSIEADGVAVPDLVALIEGEGGVVHMEEMVRDALSDKLRRDHTHVVLGCTHFPLVRHVFERVLKTFACEVVLVDPAESVASAVATRFDVAGRGTTQILVSAPSGTFERFVQTLFPEVTHVVEVIE